MMSFRYHKKDLATISSILAVLWLLLLPACDREVIVEEQRLEISDEKLEIEGIGGRDTISIASNMVWTVTCDQDWLAILPVSATGNGFVVFEAATNTGNSPRMAIVNIQAGEKTRTVTVMQEGFEKRNILFYVCGDNNLSDEPDVKIREIRKGWSAGKGEMVIYVDKPTVGAFMLRLNETKGDDGLAGIDTVMQFGVQNSADKDVFANVLTQFFAGFPADRYGMIFFSHASGWLPKGTLSKPRSLMIDNSPVSSSEMEVADFSAAIPDGYFDFIIFEACLMADVMSMYELRHDAEYILAASAEIVSPCFTHTYSADIMRLYNTSSPIPDVVAGFAASYYDYITTNYAEYSSHCSVTLSLIDTKEMDALATVTRETLQGRKLEATSLNVDELQHFDRPGKYGDNIARSRFFDLEDAVSALTLGDTVAFSAQLSKTVVRKWQTKRFLLDNASAGIPNYGHYNGFFINRHCGLTTYIERNEFPYLNEYYRNTSWYQAIYN